MLFDTHAHYTDEAFDADRDAVIRAVHDSGVGLVMNSSSDEKSSREAVAPAALELPPPYRGSPQLTR